MAEGIYEARSHQQGQLLLPAFHGNNLKSYGQAICQITEEVTQNWTSETNIVVVLKLSLAAV